MKKIYIITGQTATGKTSYAIEFAKKVNGEIINSDSRQIYKYLDIITGKDLDKTSKDFQLKNTKQDFNIGFYTFTDGTIPIWLYDIITPEKPFSTFDYRTCALEVITNIISRNKTPIIVGGSYFYLKHLLYGSVETLVEPNIKLREELNTKTVAELQEILQKKGKAIFNKLNHSDRQNPHRLIRKIEIVTSIRHPERSEESKTKIPDQVRNDNTSLEQLFPEYKIEMIGFKYVEKEKLHEIITQRVIDRLEQGAIEEVTSLLQTYSIQNPGLKTIGYSQIIAYLNKELSYKQMRKEWIVKELQYAKRQLTFMKKDPHIKWQELH